MKHFSIRLTAIVLSVIFTSNLSAQRRISSYLSYIDEYKELAIAQMKEYRIPASITLSQGLLESGAGKSKLAKESNNHFGIKCGSSWNGRSVRHTDDAPNECFRAYASAKDSYTDHSFFLKRGPRYAFLFQLDITDYKEWAKGLKKAGYATDPSYANRLITIIEDYELYKYDRQGLLKKSKQAEVDENAVPLNAHQVYLANDLAYVVARKGDTLKGLGKEFDISWRKLVKYNDYHKDYTLAEGDILYLHAKHRKASKDHIVYIVRGGDSMHSISQMFGIRLKSLYKLNVKDGEYVPEVGDRIFLR